MNLMTGGVAVYFCQFLGASLILTETVATNS